MGINLKEEGGQLSPNATSRIFSTKFVLASASRSRQRILKNAGLDFICISAEVDEGALLANLRDVTAVDAATRLAVAKAFKVATDHAGELVVGADQLLEVDGSRPPKPHTLQQAKQLLRSLRGKTAFLNSAAVAFRRGVIWRDCQTVRVKFGNFSARHLQGYLSVTGNDAVGVTGAIKLEGGGITLIDEMEGDFFAALGFPLLPFLRFLRSLETDGYA